MENNTCPPQETVTVFSSPSQTSCTINNNNEIPTQEECTREDGVCTAVDLDLDFQLQALTDRCISFKKYFIEEKSLNAELKITMSGSNKILRQTNLDFHTHFEAGAQQFLLKNLKFFICY